MLYTVIGLVLDIFGAWLIAYDLLWGYPKHLKIQWAQTRITALEQNMEEIKEMNRRLPSPPYTKEDIDSFNSEVDQKFSPWIDEQLELVRERDTAHKDKAFTVAAIGILLLTAGFTLQIVGAITT